MADGEKTVTLTAEQERALKDGVTKAATEAGMQGVAEALSRLAAGIAQLSITSGSEDFRR